MLYFSFVSFCFSNSNFILFTDQNAIATIKTVEIIGKLETVFNDTFVFNGCSALTKIQVPADQLAEYQTKYAGVKTNGAYGGKDISTLFVGY